MASTVSDETLLARVAVRDRDAFQLLFERYGKAAFGVAHYLTSSDTQAEDVVQDAMLTVWMKAGLYDASQGMARSWILCVVANRAMAANRKRRNEKVREKAVAGQSENAGAARPVEEAERKELTAALRRKVHELPAPMRRLIALYYICEMRQDEIARLLSMPQTTVSLRIRESLQELRRRLEVSGFASAVPLLAAERLGATLLEGQDLPKALGERVCSELDVARRSVRTAVAGPGKALLGVALLAVAAVAGAGWWLSQGREIESPATGGATSRPAEGAKATTGEPPAGGAAKASPFVSVYWDFNTPELPAEIEVEKGSWHWVAKGGHNGSGCWETDDESFSAILNVGLERTPIRVTLQFQIIHSGSTTHGSYLYWTNSRWIALYRNISKQTQVGREKPSWLQWKRYLGPEGTIDTWLGADRWEFCVAPPPSGENRLRLILKGRQRIDDLRIERIAPEALPDVSPFLAALERIPVKERVGKVLVPGMASPRSGEEVYIEFDGGASKAEAAK